MDGATANMLCRYAKGEVSGLAVREATGLDWALILGGLAELGLRPPRASLYGPNGPSLKRGHDLLVSAILDARS